MVISKLKYDLVLRFILNPEIISENTSQYLRDPMYRNTVIHIQLIANENLYCIIYTVHLNYLKDIWEVETMA